MLSKRCPVKISSILITAISSIILIFSPALYSKEIKNTYLSRQADQPWSVARILKKEIRVKQTRDLNEIISHIDATYTRLPEKLKAGKKINIFIDPAHGKLPDGRWQGGAATKRLSCTGRPEEYYSIQLARKLYRILEDNPHIDVFSTDDFLDVLKNKSDSYKNIPFDKTVRLAKKHKAFIIISEHLNNVSQIYKASGRVNLPGIHITRDKYGRRMLKHVKGTYSGFLTLYNKMDASGFSRRYALNLKKTLSRKGVHPNNWGFGAVGDDRFSYFFNYPVSVIYESGFISNPKEEKLLRDKDHQNLIVSGQYNALLETLDDKFGIDISGSRPTSKLKKTKRSSEMLKLSRIAIYYIKNAQTRKALRAIRTMQRRFKGRQYRKDIAYFTSVRRKILRAERYYRIAKKNKKRRRYRSYRRYLRKARRTIGTTPVFYAYRKKYGRNRGRRKHNYRRKNRSRGTYRIAAANPTSHINVYRAPRSRKIILSIEQGQTLNNAIALSLAPDDSTMKILKKKFRRAKVKKYRRVRYYSKKRKRWVRYRKKYYRRVRFSPGIYVVKLDRKLNVIAAKRVSRVRLDSRKYQNQLYLKNSYFATRNRQRAL